MRHKQRFPAGPVLLFTLLAAVLGQAQANLLSVRLLALEKGDMPEWHIKLKDEQFAALKWPANQPSPAITAQAGEELQLYSKVISGEGEPTFKVAKKVAVPKSADELLLLGWPEGDDEEAGLIAIADVYKKAKFDDWLVINNSNQAVTLRYGSGNPVADLASGEATIYQVRTKPGVGGEVIAQAMVNEELKTIYSTFWSAPDGQRSIVLFYNNDGRAKLSRIIDFLPKGEE